jgi:chromosome segregation ATPase
VKKNDLEDRELTIETKENKLNALMEDLEKQDTILNEKEEDLVKRESEYLTKLDILENHEKAILKNLEEKRKSLVSKEKEIELREKQLHKKQRNIDKKQVAVQYAKNVIEEEKGKLIDDEFEQYLHDELRKMNQGVSRSDIDLVSNMKIPGLESQNRTIYQLINQCKDLLKHNKVSEAKVYYNQIRDRYYQGGFTGREEKEAIHNMIRSLYDEINLSDIGRNR